MFFNNSVEEVSEQMTFCIDLVASSGNYKITPEEPMNNGLVKFNVSLLGSFVAQKKRHKFWVVDCYNFS